MKLFNSYLHGLLVLEKTIKPKFCTTTNYTAFYSIVYILLKKTHLFLQTLTKLNQIKRHTTILQQQSISYTYINFVSIILCQLQSLYSFYKATQLYLPSYFPVESLISPTTFNHSPLLISLFHSLPKSILVKISTPKSLFYIYTNFFARFTISGRFSGAGEIFVLSPFG